MDAFEDLLKENLPALERFIFFRVSSRFDGEDLLQETCAAAARNRDALKNPAAFKGWLLAIARNKCADYYREKARAVEIPMAAPPAVRSLYGRKEGNAVAETLNRLDGQDKQILYLFYFREWPQARIAKQLHLPLGTVKSRISRAREKLSELLKNNAELFSSPSV